MKTVDLSPMLDYFDVLRSYVEAGYLEIMPSTGEAYITLPALMTLSGADNLLAGKPLTQAQAAKEWDAIRLTVRGIWMYTTNEDVWQEYCKAWNSAPDQPATPATVNQAFDNMKKREISSKRSMTDKEPFVLHVVEAAYPHNLLLSILFGHRRRWYPPFGKAEYAEIISYR